jgi:hypothetical protein
MLTLTSARQMNAELRNKEFNLILKHTQIETTYSIQSLPGGPGGPFTKTDVLLEILLTALLMMHS